MPSTPQRSSTPINGFTRPALPDTHFLDNRIYFDSRVFAKECDQIFGQCWKFVCHESEIPLPGDYRVVNVPEHEIVVVRGDDYVIRAFYNFCPHRGARVFLNQQGHLNTGTITCLYHRWSYNVRGQCTSIPLRDAYRCAGIVPRKIALREVHAATIHGLVFVNRHDEAEPIKDYLGASVLAQLITYLGQAELEVFHFHRTELNANWKLFVETNCEGYHELLHALNRKTNLSDKIYRQRQWTCHQRGHATLENGVIGYERTGLERRDAYTFPGMPPNGHIVIDLFPDLMLNCRSTVLRIDSLIPIAPDKTALECRGLGLRGDDDRVRALRIRHHNQVWGPMGTNLAEDIRAVESQMKNMKCSSRRFSIIAREEIGVTDDAPLRAFYTEWSRLTGLLPFDIDGRVTV